VFNDLLNDTDGRDRGFRACWSMVNSPHTAADRTL